MTLAADNEAIELPAVGQEQAAQELPQYDDSPIGLTAEEQQFANASPGQQPAAGEVTAQQIAVQLRADMSAVRLHRGKWGISKKLDRSQTDKAAHAFDADGKLLSASKKLINTKAEKYRAPMGTLSEAVAYWRSVTIPYPEDGVRLIRNERIEKFNETMEAFKTTLRREAQELQDASDELREDARQRLGELYNAADYPDDIKGLFRLSWDFPSVEPPPHLMEVAPQVYAQEMARIQARFEEAVHLTEEAFADQFGKLLEKVTRQLSFGDDGKPMRFHDSSIEGLNSFFESFKHLNVGGSAQLEQLIQEAQGLLGTVTAKDVRKDVTKRGALEQELKQVASKLDAMMATRPIRQMHLLDEE